MKLTDHFRRLKVARLAAHSGSALVPKALFLKVKIVPSTTDILWLTSEGIRMCIHAIGPSRHSCLHLSVLAEVVIPSCRSGDPVLQQTFAGCRRQSTPQIPELLGDAGT